MEGNLTPARVDRFVNEDGERGQVEEPGRKIDNNES